MVRPERSNDENYVGKNSFSHDCFECCMLKLAEVNGQKIIRYTVCSLHSGD